MIIISSSLVIVFLFFSVTPSFANDDDFIAYVDEGEIISFDIINDSPVAGVFTANVILKQPPGCTERTPCFNGPMTDQALEGTFKWQALSVGTFSFQALMVTCDDALCAQHHPAEDSPLTTTIVVNPQPVANAGLDQTVKDRTTVILDGSRSTGSGLKYTWTQISPAPLVTLSDIHSAKPFFTAPSLPTDSTLRFQLVVKDDHLTRNPSGADPNVRITGGNGGVSTSQVTITVKAHPKPMANAGPDEHVKERQSVTLDGSGSFDNDGDHLTYKWTQTAGPTPWMNSFSNVLSSHPTFIAPALSKDSTLTFQLIVNDGIVDSLPSTVNIQVSANHPPIADAGTDQTVDEGTQVSLSGAGSSDQDGDMITYKWKQTSGEPILELIGADTASPTFDAPKVDQDTTFTFQLVVNDGAVDGTTPSSVNVVVKPKLTLQVTTPNPPELNPYPLGIDSYIGDNPPPPQSEITVIAKHISDNSPAHGFNIKLESCTEIGKAPTLGTADADGHTNDLRGDSCEKGDRPAAILKDSSKASNPIIATTDDSGSATLDYIPPKFTDVNGTSYFISGKDTINALWQDNNDNPSIEGATAVATTSIITRVPDLQQMPGSERCPPGHIGESFGGTEGYFFVKQDFHECLFYGTAGMEGALIDLANAYVEKQKECMNNLDGQCSIQLGPNPTDPIISVGIDRVIPLGITSMSLPWGGLSDDNGDWQTPHNFNNNGMEVDISWKDNNGTTTDDDHKILLWSLMKADERWVLPIDTQGGNFAKTYDLPSSSLITDNRHFHLEYAGQ